MKLGTWLDVSEDLHSTLQSALQHSVDLATLAALCGQDYSNF